ncbi:MAG: AsmA-like C-terminal region-containing protein [Candidatus Acidiferrum sp.]
MRIGRVPRKWWWVLLPGTFVLLLLVLSVYVYFWPDATENQIRLVVTRTLSDRFHSDVDLRTLDIKVFPILRVTGGGLVLHYHGRKDVPPLVQIEKFSFNAGILGLLHRVKHIPLIRVQHMIINIPPREAGSAHAQTAPHYPASARDILVDRVICDDTDILIYPQKAEKGPLEWQIHNLVLTSAGVNKHFAFEGNLTNAKPKGEIATHGRFGPWNAEDPGGTPVAGEYQFTNADLGPFPGIAGILSSTGKYDGVLSQLEVQGETDTPDFSLDKVGKPVPLHTDFSATVDGTNGDTYLHPVKATLGKSLIIAEGKVVRMPEKKGHLISIDATVTDGRIADFLSLAVNSDKPLLTGPVKINAKLTIPPGHQQVIEKMILDGQFGVENASWSSATLREKLASLSRHGMGKPQDSEAGSAVSDLSGNFLLENGVIRFRRLNFSVEGAAIDLTGTYALVHGDLDFAGHLRLQAKLSQTVTGKKSVFLKALDPFFEKGGSGTVLPIDITGTRDKPVFGVSVFHKRFDKHVSANK